MDATPKPPPDIAQTLGLRAPAARRPLLRAAVVVLVPELFRLVGLPDSVAANLRLALYGFSLVVIMHVRPQGVMGRYRVA